MMKELTLKKIMKSKPVSDPGYLFHTNLTYPTFEDNDSNFITDYQANAASYNGYAILKRGDQVIKIDEEDYNPAWDYLKEVSGYVTDVHLAEWARLYYALSLSYNPLYNVDGETVRSVTQKQRTDAYGAQSGSSVFGATSQTDNIGAVSVTDNFGARSTTDNIGARSLTDNIGAVSKTDQYGNKSETLGAHTDNLTQKSVSYNSATQKETGASENAYGSQTNTEAAYTDTHSELARSDSHSEAARSDSHSEAARSDTHNTAARTDTHTGLARNDSHSEAAHSDTHTDAAFSETETRKGNIGVTMTQQLLEAEWEFRKKSFFSQIINQMLDEVGFYYNGGIGL